MRISFNPVSFRASVPGQPQTSASPEAMNERRINREKELELFNERLHSDEWIKSSLDKTDYISLLAPYTDSDQYHIFPNGKVILFPGWQVGSHVLLQEHEGLGKYYKEEKEFLKKEELKRDIEGFNYILQDKNWEKSYNTLSDTVRIKLPNTKDGTEYTIYNNGKVVVSSGWSNPSVIVEENEALGKYVQAMKEYSKNSGISFGNSEESVQTKTYTPSGNLIEAFKNNMLDLNETVLKPSAQDLKTVTSPMAQDLQDTIKGTAAAAAGIKPETAANYDIMPDGQNSQKAEIYKNRLHDDRWEKLYSKEDNTIYLKQKNLFDGLEYAITPDGTVKEIGLNVEPAIILENDNDSQKLFETADFAPKNKKGVFSKSKDAFGNVWKFFASFGQMALAGAKGLTYGALTGIGMLAGSWVFNTLPKAFAKEGPKFSQIMKHPFGNIGTFGKVLSAAAGAAVLGYNLIVGKMAANEKTAVIDHKLYTGHRDT